MQTLFSPQKNTFNSLGPVDFCGVGFGDSDIALGAAGGTVLGELGSVVLLAAAPAGVGLATGFGDWFLSLKHVLQ